MKCLRTRGWTFSRAYREASPKEEDLSRIFTDPRIGQVTFAFLIAPVMLGMSEPASAQTSASIEGTVTAQDGTPISGANITYGRMVPLRAGSIIAMTPPVGRLFSGPNMAKYFPCLLVAALAGLALAAPQGVQVPFSITISASNGAYEAGSDVKIRLVFKNISGEEVPYTRELGMGVEPHGEIFTDVVVRDAKGELAPETEYYRASRGKRTGAARDTAGRLIPKPWVGGSFTWSMLKPGESREEDIDVSKLYDLSQPGVYTISAARPLSDVATDPRSKIVAKSNTLTITITK